MQIAWIQRTFIGIENRTSDTARLWGETLLPGGARAGGPSGRAFFSVNPCDRSLLGPGLHHCLNGKDKTESVGNDDENPLQGSAATAHEAQKPRHSGESATEPCVVSL